MSERLTDMWTYKDWSICVGPKPIAVRDYLKANPDA